jgi:hypothetical protein
MPEHHISFNYGNPIFNCRNALVLTAVDLGCAIPFPSRVMLLHTTPPAAAQPPLCTPELRRPHHPSCCVRVHRCHHSLLLCVSTLSFINHARRTATYALITRQSVAQPLPATVPSNSGTSTTVLLSCSCAQSILRYASSPITPSARKTYSAAPSSSFCPLDGLRAGRTDCARVGRTVRGSDGLCAGWTDCARVGRTVRGSNGLCAGRTDCARVERTVRGSDGLCAGRRNGLCAGRTECARVERSVRGSDGLCTGRTDCARVGGRDLAAALERESVARRCPASCESLCVVK